MDRYAAYETDDGGVIFTKFGDTRPLYAAGLMPDKAVVLYSFQAKSWNEAMTEHHIRMGWEPYIPMDD